MRAEGYFCLNARKDGVKKIRSPRQHNLMTKILLVGRLMLDLEKNDVTRLEIPMNYLQLI